MPKIFIDPLGIGGSWIDDEIPESAECPSPFKGLNHTEETKQVIGDANRGKSAWNKGKTGIYSKETLRKISQNNAKAFQGKKHSEESKKKMRDAWKRRKFST